MQVALEPDASLAQNGLKVTMSKGGGIGVNEASTYLVSEKAFKGTLQAKALDADADGQEIGRSKVEAEFAADDGKYLTFPFDQAMDSQMVRKYQVSVR